MKIELIDEINLPEYSVIAIEYSDYSGLSDDDIILIEKFVSKYPGCSFEYGEERFFTNSPEFGLPCTCIATKIYGHIS